MESGAVVEEQPPRKTRKPRGPNKAKGGAIKPEHIETWMVQVFAFTAMMKHAQHWQINNPEIEVRPWAGSAADLINEYLPADMAQKAIGMNAGIAVSIGIFMLVFTRMEMDARIARQAVQEPQSETTRTHPQEPVQMRHRKRQPQPEHTAPSNGQTPGGGATPTRPAEPLVGLGMNPGGLT